MQTPTGVLPKYLVVECTQIPNCVPISALPCSYPLFCGHPNPDNSIPMSVGRLYPYIVS